MDYDKIISNLFFVDDWHIDKTKSFLFKKTTIKCKYPNIQQYLYNRFEDYDNLKEILYRIRFNIEKRPVCKECGGRLKFVGKGGRLFQTYCSDSCRARSKDNQEKIKQTNVKNWGTPGVYDSPKYQEKLFNERGYRTVMQSEEFKEKRKQTFIKRYGTLNMFDVPEIREKIEQTCLRKYGARNPYLSEKCIKAKDRYYQTYAGKVNSKPENQTYELLSKKFPNVKRNYKSKEYPWRCDFYIPELNLYIECQYSQYHMGKPYIEETCKDKLLELQEKSLKRKEKTGKSISQYDKMIYTWTDLDVRKRNKAKENNLNYKELWNLKEAEQFIESL